MKHEEDSAYEKYFVSLASCASLQSMVLIFRWLQLVAAESSCR